MEHLPAVLAIGAIAAAIALGWLFARSRARAGEEKFRALFESAPDAMVMLGADGKIALLSAQTEKLFGYPRGELLGQPIEVLLPPRFRIRHPALRREYFAAPHPRPMGAGLDLAGLRRDGTEFAAEISLSPIKTHEGTLVTAAIRDISARKSLEEENLRRLHEASRLKNEFLANMSHELRTPLNSVMGFAAFIESGKAGPVTELQKEYLGDILTGSRHLLQLINDILDLAKIEAGKMKLDLAQVDLAPLLVEVRDGMRLLAAEKNIALSFDVDPSMPPATLDRAKLKQVMFNYLSNAIKFTPDNGSVAVRVAPDRGETFRIEVEDTGIGIAAEDLPHLFADFQQLDAGSAKKYQGTGLGLSLTKRIVEAQGGMVGVKSTPGVGSTFWAILPKVVSDGALRPLKAPTEESVDHPEVRQGADRR